MSLEYEEFRDRYKALVYEALPDLARARSMIAYSDLAHKVGMPTDEHTLRDLFGWLLGEISTCEHDAGRPMLSAIVVNKSDGLPGIGFFNLAVDFGRLPAGANKKARMAFWKKERNRVYEEWAVNHD